MCHRIFFHVSRHFDSLNGRKSMAKPRTERSLLFPSKEFREEVRKASKDRGFRSEQAFILAACASTGCSNRRVAEVCHYLCCGTRRRRTPRGTRSRQAAV